MSLVTRFITIHSSIFFQELPSLCHYFHSGIKYNLVRRRKSGKKEHSYYNRRCSSRKWRACQVHTCRHRTTSSVTSFLVALTTTRDENGVFILASHDICWQSFLGSLKRYLRASLSTACIAQLAASSEMTNEVISQALPGETNCYNWFMHSNEAVARV